MKLLDSSPPKSCEMYYEFDGKLSLDKRMTEGTTSPVNQQQQHDFRPQSMMTAQSRSNGSTFNLNNDEESEDIIVDEDPDDEVFSPSSSGGHKYDTHSDEDTKSNDKHSNNNNNSVQGQEDDEVNRLRRIVLLRNHRRPRLLRRRCLFRQTSGSGNENSLISTSDEEDHDDHHHYQDEVKETEHKPISPAAVVVAAKEKLVNLTQEKLRSYSTDLHSNSDGLRNRVLVESALKKFLLNDLSLSCSPPSSSSTPTSSPCNTPVKVGNSLMYRVPSSSSPGFTPPSTPRKRSSSESSSYSTPGSPSSFSFDAACSPSSSYDCDEEGTSVLSDSIKRMKLMHSSPVSSLSRRCSRVFDHESSSDDATSMDESFIQG